MITRLQFKEDAEDGYLTGDRAEHLYVYDLKSQAAAPDHFRRVLRVGGRTGRLTAARIVFTSNREAEPDASYKSDLWIVAADNTDRGQSAAPADER